MQRSIIDLSADRRLILKIELFTETLKEQKLHSSMKNKRLDFLHRRITDRNRVKPKLCNRLSVMRILIIIPVVRVIAVLVAIQYTEPHSRKYPAARIEDTEVST